MSASHLTTNQVLRFHASTEWTLPDADAFFDALEAQATALRLKDRSFLTPMILSINQWPTEEERERLWDTQTRSTASYVRICLALQSLICCDWILPFLGHAFQHGKTTREAFLDELRHSFPAPTSVFFSHYSVEDVDDDSDGVKVALAIAFHMFLWKHSHVSFGMVSTACDLDQLDKPVACAVTTCAFQVISQTRAPSLSEEEKRVLHRVVRHLYDPVWAKVLIKELPYLEIGLCCVGLLASADVETGVDFAVRVVKRISESWSVTKEEAWPRVVEELVSRSSSSRRCGAPPSQILAYLLDSGSTSPSVHKDTLLLLVGLSERALPAVRAHHKAAKAQRRANSLACKHAAKEREVDEGKKDETWEACRRAHDARERERQEREAREERERRERIQREREWRARNNREEIITVEEEKDDDVQTLMPSLMDDGARMRAKRSARKAAGVEATQAHAARLRQREEERVAALERRAAWVALGTAIATGGTA